MLNFPSFRPIGYPQSLTDNSFFLHLGRNISLFAPDSIVGIYYNSDIILPKFSLTCRMPNINRIHQSIKLYAKSHKITRKKEFDYLYNIVQLEETICIHIRSGDLGGVSDSFIAIILDVVTEFDNVYKSYNYYLYHFIFYSLL